MNWWALSVTFVDEENNQFLNLGGAAFRTKRERDANLARIAVVDRYTGFVLDVEGSQGIEADRNIEPLTVEALLSEPVAVLITRARIEEAQAQKEHLAQMNEKFGALQATHGGAR